MPEDEYPHHETPREHDHQIHEPRPGENYLLEREPPFDTPATPSGAIPADTVLFTQDQPKPRAIAPVWHTILLVIAILVYSAWGAAGPHTGAANPIAPPSGAGAAHEAATSGINHVRLIRYALTGLLELGVVLWIAFGLRLRKIPFRSLFGAIPRGLNNITMDFLIAAGFWVCSMIVLMVFALGWFVVQNQFHKHEAADHSVSSPQSPSNPSTHGRPKTQGEEQKPFEQQRADMLKQLMELAPANGVEITAWFLLCLVVGFSEELIFRGYMQSQGIALLRNVPVSLILTALVFGFAHGYQGLYGIFLIGIYGFLFGLLAHIRKSLCPGMIAHSWHDFFMGMLLALFRTTHLLDHPLTLPK